MLGLKPVLVEPELETFNIDPAQLKSVLSEKTRAICVTHMFGKACRMDAICAFARQYNLRIVEDCAQSHGARLGNQMTGTFGDAGCFSFYPTKNLGALGDAGAVVTNNDVLADRLRYIRNYGSKQKYVNRYIGINSRLDDLHAAMLRVKLKNLDRLLSISAPWPRSILLSYPNGLQSQCRDRTNLTCSTYSVSGIHYVIL